MSRQHPLFGLFGGGKRAYAREESSVLAESGKMQATLQVGRGDVGTQLEMIQLTTDDLRILKALAPVVTKHVDSIVESFYQMVLRIAPLKELVIRNGTNTDALKITLRKHLLEMFNGVIDEDFVRRRSVIADAHYRVGLDPKWYMGAFQHLQHALLAIIDLEIQDKQEALRVGQAVLRLLNFEQQLVLDAYSRKNLEEKEKEFAQKIQLKGQIADISHRLAHLTEQTNASTQELVATSTDVIGSVEQSAVQSRESRKLTQSGADKVNDLDSRIKQISDRSSMMEKAVEGLKASSVQIKNIVSIVQEISNQTKLLSLNAAIEAARAGEHGAGFGVVANEVKKLSEDTTHAVNQISDLIQQSNQYTQDVVKSIGEVQSLVKLGQSEAGEARSVFDEIMHALDASLNEVVRVNEEIASLVRIIEEVGASTEQVALTAEKLEELTNEM